MLTTIDKEKEKKEKKEKKETIRKSVRKSKMVDKTTEETEESSKEASRASVIQSEPYAGIVMTPIMPTKKPSILPENDSLPKDIRLRNKCINEIIDTERDYIVDLELIIEVRGGKDLHLLTLN
jgi:hypothetical protein